MSPTRRCVVTSGWTSIPSDGQVSVAKRRSRETSVFPAHSQTGERFDIREIAEFELNGGRWVDLFRRYETVEGERVSAREGGVFVVFHNLIDEIEVRRGGEWGPLRSCARW